MNGLQDMAADAMADAGPVWPSTVSEDTYVMLTVNGHNLTVVATRSLSGLARDIQASMIPEEVAELAGLLGGQSQPQAESCHHELRAEFWEAIDAAKAGQTSK